MSIKLLSKIVNKRGLYVGAFLIGTIIIPFQTWADEIETDVPALKNVFANDFTIGCLLSYKHVGFPSDPVEPGQSAVLDTDGGYLIDYHMNCMSPGNNMKALYTIDISASATAYNTANAGQKDSVNTHPVIRFNGDLRAQLNWAERQEFNFRGHTLVWHNQTPAAFFYTGYSTSNARVTKEVMIERMENYIREVIRLIHQDWQGMVTAIDVVNESVNDNGTFRTTGNEWYTTFGDNTYIMKAFELARTYTEYYNETQIKLYYNDYSTHIAAKADGIVSLMTPVFQAGYLDGIGMQEHDENDSPTAEEWIASYNKFDAICTEMAVTEFDVATGSDNPTESVLTAQANQYAALFKCFVERSYNSGRGKIINVSKDGLNDQYTFQTGQSSSLWDSQNQCKPAFFAVVDVGIYYNSLDSLIVDAQKYEEENYPAFEWSEFVTAMEDAEAAMDQNYSAELPAYTALENAFNDLKDAIADLQVSNGIGNILCQGNCRDPFAYVRDGMIFIENLPIDTRIVIYNLSGSLLHSYTDMSDVSTLPYEGPCIIRVLTGKDETVIKLLW